jgi:oligopeptide transport system permease protein
MDLLIHVFEWEEVKAMKANDINNISQDKFVFVSREKVILDKALETKQRGYFADAWFRFSRNKGSVIAAFIIVLLILFSILVPIFSKFNLKFNDGYYKYMPPKSEFLSKYGIMTGQNNVKGVNQQLFDYYNAIPDAVVSVDKTYEIKDGGRAFTYYDITLDSYKKVGYVYKLLTAQELEKALAYQEETGVQLLYPMIDTKQINNPSYSEDPNLWYENTPKGAAKYNKDGSYNNIYAKDPESKDGYKYAVSKMNGGQYQVRVLYYDWFQYERGFEPIFIFGSDGYGKDILVGIANGARFSFILSILVATINFIIGTVYGAIEGYYGGKIDLIMERIVDILAQIPFIIAVTLFQMFFARKVGVVVCLIFAFMLTGWIGIAGRVRTQFYRFKGQEYVLAARTLGAKDKRLIFRHILPNAMGTIITSAVLMVPGVIITESNLSFLGIVDFQTSNLTSIGTLLSNGQSSLTTTPHVIFFPAVFISILMICFNMFGNGLRDAFNPSLRGAED